MCQIFAMSCSAPATVTFAFSGFSARGGITGEHRDGFGLAFHQDRACRLFVDQDPAGEAALAGFLRTHPIRARIVLGHVRKATQGAVEIVNCHPFVREWRGRYWSFCHHGDLKGYAPPLTGRFHPVGTTDSELAFCWILQELDRHAAGAGVPAWESVAQVLAQWAEDIGDHGSFNFLLSDGETVFARAATKLHWVQREHPFPLAHLVDCEASLDLASANNPQDRMALVATEPLTRNENWQALAPGELLVLRDGTRAALLGATRAARPAPKRIGRPEAAAPSL